MAYDNSQQTFNSFAEFYPFYLAEHSNAVCRRMHFLGICLVLSMSGYILLSQQYWLVLSLPVLGYSCSWIGHFFFEKNKPATFSYPVYSFWGDWVMFKDMLIGRVAF